jgi:hypothetical protein
MPEIARIDEGLRQHVGEERRKATIDGLLN